MLTENSSGAGKNALIPEEIKKWNWGAFLLNWIWGLRNNTYIALLMFVPILNFIIPFYLGFKGNELAWRNKKWESLEEFIKIQKKWAMWGIIIIILLLVINIAIFTIAASKVNFFETVKVANYISKEALDVVQANEEAVNLFGEPIKNELGREGKFSGNEKEILTASQKISGPNKKGTIFLKAKKIQDKYEIYFLEVRSDDGEKLVILE